MGTDVPLEDREGDERLSDTLLYFQTYLRSKVI
jgi:hypothetical protein